MKSTITLLLVGAVTLVCGNYFGWWMAPIPGLEMMPTYEQKKTVRENQLKARRKLAGLEDEEGENVLDNQDAKRRSEALRTGGGL